MTLQSELDLFVTAADAFVDQVARIEASQWDGPGLGDWDLRALVGHTTRSLITVTEYVDRPVAAEVHPSAVSYYVAAAEYASGADRGEIAERGRQAGEALGDHPAAAVKALRDAAVQRLDGQPDVLMHTIVGGMWLRNYLPTRTFELAAHGLDIARALRLAPTVPAEVLAAAVGLAGQVAVVTDRGADVLLALTGRERLPDGFSVV